jgi:hypothetical protein
MQRRGPIDNQYSVKSGACTMSELSQQSIETLLDLVEIKLSCLEVYDREDAREKSYLEASRRELLSMLQTKRPAALSSGGQDLGLSPSGPYRATAGGRRHGAARTKTYDCGVTNFSSQRMS